MTAPIQEPGVDRSLQGLAYQRDQLLRRPAPVSTPGGDFRTTAAVARKYLANVTYDSSTDIIFETLFATAGMYTPDTADPSSFQYVMLAEEGFYRADFEIAWETDFAGGSLAVYLQPTCVIGGIGDVLITAPGGSAEDDWTQQWTGMEQLTAAEADHHQICTTVWFNFEATQVGSASFGVGERIRTVGTGTKTMSGGIVITRISDLLPEVT